jgi:hypothetical protein
MTRGERNANTAVAFRVQIFVFCSQNETKAERYSPGSYTIIFRFLEVTCIFQTLISEERMHGGRNGSATIKSKESKKETQTNTSHRQAIADHAP